MVHESCEIGTITNELKKSLNGLCGVPWFNESTLVVFNHLQCNLAVPLKEFEEEPEVGVGDPMQTSSFNIFNKMVNPQVQRQPDTPHLSW